MVDIVVFGAGEAYRKKKSYFEEHNDRIKIVAFVDNDCERQGEELDGVKIYAPSEIKNLSYDGIFISTRQYRNEIVEQLIELGVDKSFIWDLTHLKHTALRGKKTIYKCNGNMQLRNKERILIVTTDMGFSGGILVAIYAAQALKNKGYDVMLAAPSVQEELLQEIISNGLDITIWYCLPYIYDEDVEWIKEFDIVIVSVFQMMNCAYEISKIRPVLWWIHEDRSIWRTFYQDTKREFYKIDTSEWMGRLKVMGVSPIAQEAFNYFYPNIIKKNLPFGIPDQYSLSENEISHEGKIIFAVTAGFSVIKGQRVLVDAVAKLTQEEKNAIEVWFIGPSGKNQKNLEAICGGEPCFKFCGLLTHEETIKTILQIDVLVCPSMIETMSMSTVEGMMFGKLCIATDMTGIADYINNGKNGFVVQAGNSSEMAKCISWIINNRDSWGTIKQAARKNYEDNFSLDVFADALEKELKECAEDYNENNINVSASISQSKGK